MKPNGHNPPGTDTDLLEAVMVYRGIAEARTPLTVIQGCSQLLAHRIRGNRSITADEILETLDLIEQSARTLESELRTIEGRMEK